MGFFSNVLIIAVIFLVGWYLLNPTGMKDSIDKAFNKYIKEGGQQYIQAKYNGTEQTMSVAGSPELRMPQKQCIQIRSEIWEEIGC